MWVTEYRKCNSGHDEVPVARKHRSERRITIREQAFPRLTIEYTRGTRLSAFVSQPISNSAVNALSLEEK